MKKVLFIAVVAVASLASCKKDRTCTCTSTTAGVAGTPQVTVYNDVKKGEAKANCVNYTTTSTVGSTSYTTVTTCELK
jgi:hypothetical protein